MSVLEPILRWRRCRGERFPAGSGNRFALALTFCLGAGCGGSGASVQELPAAAGFTRETLAAGDFELAALRRTTPVPGAVLTIYIEGDGRAFRHRNRPSADPTPKRALGRELALQDPGGDVLYLARPCQFRPHPLPPPCRPEAWTTGRFSEAVVAGVNEAIDQAARGHDGIALVGYSGGGTLAALIAARRRDVVSLVTIAANLDHGLWTGLHGVTALTGSLDAADAARTLQSIPQVHYVGGRDDVVPVAIVQSFTARMDDTSRVAIRVEPGFDHDCCWVDAWPRLLAESRAVLQK